MRDSGRHCASPSRGEPRRPSPGPRRAGHKGSGLAAAALILATLAQGGEATAFRRGLASTTGAATLGAGHALWVGVGFPALGAGWAVALHPRVDLGVHGEVDFGHPAALERLVVGGGGGLGLRVGLLRGRTSLALVVRGGATAYGEGRGVAAVLDLLSPALAVSFRLGPRLALHSGLGVDLAYVTRPALLVGGFVARGGLSWRATDRLGLFARVAAGAMVWSPTARAEARLEALVGLEVFLARPDAS